MQQLQILFAIIVPLAGIGLNPLSGVLMDRVGLPIYTGIMALITMGMSVLEPFPNFFAQQLFIWFFGLYQGAAQNVPGKWPLYFMPPHLFGIAFASQSAFSGCFGFVLDKPLSVLGITGDAPTCIMLGISSFSLAAISAHLLLWGL